MQFASNSVHVKFLSHLGISIWIWISSFLYYLYLFFFFLHRVNGKSCEIIPQDLNMGNLSGIFSASWGTWQFRIHDVGTKAVDPQLVSPAKSSLLECGKKWESAKRSATSGTYPLTPVTPHRGPSSSVPAQDHLKGTEPFFSLCISGSFGLLSARMLLFRYLTVPWSLLQVIWEAACEGDC